MSGRRRRSAEEDKLSEAQLANAEKKKGKKKSSVKMEKTDMPPKKVADGPK